MDTATMLVVRVILFATMRDMLVPPRILQQVIAVVTRNVKER
jgi:hypothetical protein